MGVVLPPFDSVTDPDGVEIRVTPVILVDENGDPATAGGGGGGSTTTVIEDISDMVFYGSSVNDESRQILALNVNRKGFLVQNQSDTDPMWIMFGAPSGEGVAFANEGCFKIEAGLTWIPPYNYTGAVHGIAAATKTVNYHAEAW